MRCEGPEFGFVNAPLPTGGEIAVADAGTPVVVRVTGTATGGIWEVAKVPADLRRLSI